MSTLKASSLTKSYKNRPVVNGVSIEINSGEIVGLLGPNGAGKTTTFYMILGLTGSENGNIYLDEKDITLMPIHKRAQLGIGYLPQEPSVFRKLTTWDNIYAILELNPKHSKHERDEICNELIENFNLSNVSSSLGISLSGGERRRLEIARCLAINPRFILFDEPFAGVDPISILDIKETISSLSQQGIGILITDHNVRETLDICDHAYILSNGKIMAKGVPEEILANEQVKKVYLGDNFKI
ncbi:MAG: LPS export ABC transporter ATP-binding protein [Francisellaceae bacterium]|jgi:lipopolysaccharide export system ATP-binding protein|nr:LPS export ABC transporter ATP-binding protein [Francisellaceae bacterium]MBT6208349.1 LPS export ABC transporter ATP-binding protein [Francisellaceae bacterium]MBT6539155.1 LPS export ABC transporter ATP-binding protein [Francisellaceae bacterium]